MPDLPTGTLAPLFAEHVRRGPLIGRAAELARAVQELDLARAGALPVLALEGEVPREAALACPTQAILLGEVGEPGG
ncbi:MAG TPA: hypothetical protein VGL23_25055 [Chloroflexota bacterium]|jgi:hypothetical protein